MIESKEKCLMTLICKSYKLAISGAQISNLNEVFSWKVLQVVFLLFQVFLVKQANYDHCNKFVTARLEEPVTFRDF